MSVRKSFVDPFPINVLRARIDAVVIAVDIKIDVGAARYGNTGIPKTLPNQTSTKGARIIVFSVQIDLFQSLPRSIGVECVE